MVSVDPVEPFSNLNGAFAQSVEEADRLNRQAIQLYIQGRYADAEPLFKRSLAIWEKALGPDHPGVATALNNEGGGGKVYRAIDLRDGQEVAVKEVSLAAHDEEKRKRIIELVRNEYAVAVTLPEHPGIATASSTSCRTWSRGAASASFTRPSPSLPSFCPY